MLTRKGDIYLADVGCYNTTKSKDRPVIIIGQDEDKKLIRVIPMTAAFKSDFPTRVITKVKMNDLVYEFTVLCESASYISEDKLHTKIGHATNKTVVLLERILSLLSISDSLMDNYISEVKKNATKEESEILIDDEDKLGILLNSVEEIKQITKKANSTVSIWRERFIGFLFGIIASIIATLVTNNIK